MQEKPFYTGFATLRHLLAALALFVCCCMHAVSAVPAGTTILFDNTTSQWSDIYISFTAESNVGKDITQYVPQNDKWCGKMTNVEGDIYSFTTSEDNSTGYFSFWSKKIDNYGQVWQVDVLLHYEFYTDKPCYKLTYSDYNSDRQSSRWHANVIPSPITYISASQGNPINKGTSVTLTANNITSACTWEYSIDSGTSWLAYPDATSGTYGETITVTPTEDTQYRVTSGGKQLVYEVQISNEKYAVVGPVIEGVEGWSTTPTEDAIFIEDGVNRWTVDFTYGGGQFLILNKNGGKAGESWGWESKINLIDNGTNVSGNNGGNMSVLNFSKGDGVKLVLIKKDNGRYEVSAEAGHFFKIKSTAANPITQGDDLSLYAVGAEGTCSWYYSYDEITWTAFTGTTTGALNDTIKPTPIVGTFYKVIDGKYSATYQVQVIIKCTGRSQTHLEEHFSSPALASATARREDSNVPSSYVFSKEGKELHDGFYAVVANPLYCGRGGRTTPNDCHSADCLGNVNSSGDYWFVDRTDHTGDTNGGMLLLNCNNKGEVMYSYKKSGLCKNIYMTFSAWFASASTGIPIKTRFMVLDKSGNEIAAARFDVDAISVEDGWKQGQTAFFSGDNDELTVQIVNNGSSGSGNDILVDDITFTSCIPKLEIKPSIDVLCGDDAVLTVESEGIEQIFGMAPYYLWQELDENDSDPATQWHDIADDPVAGRDSHGGSGFDKIKYEMKTEYKEIKPKYRVIMSSDPAIARQVGHNVFPVCNVYAETEIAIVDCGCAPQTIELKSGDDTQDLCGGETVSTVYYKASGEKTNSIGVDGLPSSVSATISGTALTISGKAPDVDVIEDYTAKIYAKGVEGTVCKSDTLEFNLHVRPTPDAPNVNFN